MKTILLGLPATHAVWSSKVATDEPGSLAVVALLRFAGFGVNALTKKLCGISYLTYSKWCAVGFDNFATSDEGETFYAKTLSYMSETAALAAVLAIAAGTVPLPAFTTRG
jgi:hypothetical protein